MDVKRDILWRVYLTYILMIIGVMVILGKAFYIQQVEGKYWRSLSDSLRLKVVDIEAERGTIYSEDGQMLSTSIPQFDIYIDFNTEGLRAKNGQLFRSHVDSLAWHLSKLFNDESPAGYKRILQDGFKKKMRYYSFRKKVSYREYQAMQEFPLIRMGRNKSGFIAEERSIRKNPYEMLAFRTIGLARDTFKVGLEMKYDSVLKGVTGKRLMRKIAGGVLVPVSDQNDVEPQSGKDIITNLDVFIQEVTENALMDMMVQNQAEHGCAIVMEVKTGKIKAIANLGRNRDGSYSENFNYAINPSEPGSTFKLATLMALLEDRKIDLKQVVNLEGGSWQVGNRTVFDSERHGRNEVTIQQAFEFSSNVGMAKLISKYYSRQPSVFFQHLNRIQMDTLTGVDLLGERNPLIIKPGSRYWSGTTLPWMSFGYGLKISPLQTAMLYNAVANGGKMFRPYLVNTISEEGLVVKTIDPKVVSEKICSKPTIQQLHQALVGACQTPGSTGFQLFKNAPYTVAGKTGTALVADGVKGYADKIYQSSFAGYFPADNPQYTIVVVIKNKPQAAMFYGASVAGPVFKKIADRLYTSYVFGAVKSNNATKLDSAQISFSGHKDDVTTLMQKLSLPVADQSGPAAEWITVQTQQKKNVLNRLSVTQSQVPVLKGLGLKDAIYLCEEAGLHVKVVGKGKVISQSIEAGTTVKRGNTIQLTLQP